MTPATEHAAIEIAAEKALDRGASGQTRVFVWDLPTRLTHWGMALSLAVLSVTGIYIGDPFLIVPGEARYHFAMGTMRAVHFWAAIVFTIAVPSRLLWMLMSPNYFSRWHQFLPVTRIRLEQMWGTLKFYLLLQRTPPEGMLGHNPLAGAAYLGVYGLEMLMILTGLALYGMFATHSPLHAFAGLLPLFGGAQMARLIHHVVMWLLIGFFIHHLYSAVLTSVIEKNGTLESIFSGWKWFRSPRRDK